MNMKRYNIEKGEKYFYYIDKKSGTLSCESLGLLLKEDIEVEVLKRAVANCMKLFPLFCLKPVIDDNGEVYLADNDEDVPVFEAPLGESSFGTADTNKYLFAVCYDHAAIEVFAHHSLGDGRMVLRFLATVVYEYLKLKGYDIEANDFIVTEKDLEKDTILSSMLTDAFKVDIQEPKGVYIPRNVFDFVQSQNHPNESTRAFRVNWNQKALMKDCKSIGVTVAAYIDAVVCEAMNRCVEVGDHHIVAGVPVDMRAKMNSASHRNYIGNVRVPFYPEWRELSFEEQAVKLKEQLKLQTEFSNIISRVRMLGPIVDKMMELPLCKEESMKPQASGKKPSVAAQTFLLTNIGRILFPESMLEYIEDIIINVQTGENSVCVALLSLGEMGCAVIGQSFNSTEFVEKFRDVLAERGIPIECSEMKLLKKLKLGIENFDRI